MRLCEQHRSATAAELNPASHRRTISGFQIPRMKNPHQRTMYSHVWELYEEEEEGTEGESHVNHKPQQLLIEINFHSTFCELKSVKRRRSYNKCWDLPIGISANSSWESWNCTAYTRTNTLIPKLNEQIENQFGQVGVYNMSILFFSWKSISELRSNNFHWR